MLERHETQYSLQDVGGLLGTVPEDVMGRARLERIQSDSAAEGAPRTITPVARVLGHDDDIELADLGGLMAADHEPEASAAALSRVTGAAHTISSTRGGRLRPLPPQNSGWESLDIQDPGGLLSKR